MFYLPHGLTVDHEDNVWVTDVGAHQVQYDGKFALSYPGSLFCARRKCRVKGLVHRNNRHRMRAPISCQSKNCRHKMADL